MIFNPNIFKAYDIRGLYPEELSTELAHTVGRAFVEYISAKDIAVGYDMRESSPSLATALREGAIAGGARVLDLGMVSTDMMYFAVSDGQLSGGAVVTASHNPKQYNGFKLVREGSLALSDEAGLKEMCDWITNKRTFELQPGGRVEKRDILMTYAQHVRRFVDESKVRRFKIIMDAANGMAGAVAPTVFGGLPLECVELNFKPDGSFPNHEPNPLLEVNRRQIVTMVHRESADLGIAWDGDADRCFFIDDQGNFVPGDFVTALLGQAFLANEPGSSIVYDVRASWAVRDIVLANGGKPLINRVGHSFFKKRMREEGAIFGGEVSGHYYFRDNDYADNGMIPALLILELMSTTKKKLSELLAPLREKYFISGEINSKVDDANEVISRAKERYKDGIISTLDGLSIEYDDWHFNLRASNTEPFLRLNLEALSNSEMLRRRDEVLTLIRSGAI